MIHSGLVITAAVTTFSFGVIQERDGIVSHRFMLCNESGVPVRICQTYPSCGCTSVACDTGLVAPHNSMAVDVSFIPTNRGGEFYETASLVVASSKDTVVVTLSVEGTVITSEETLMRQYPVRQGSLRLTTDSLSMGVVRRGESKTMYVGVLKSTKPEDKQIVPVTFVADSTVGWGRQNNIVHISVNGNPVQYAEVKVNAVVVPHFDDSIETNVLSLPHIICHRRVERNEKQLEIANSGGETLMIYRAYTDDGKNLPARYPIKVSPGEHRAVFIGKVSSQDRHITLITNDPRHARFVVTLFSK